jgi:hypothetical protein
MNSRLLLTVGYVCLTVVSQCLHAQSGEATANYSFVIYNPAKSLAGSRYLNGGGGSLGVNLNEYFMVKGEFQGYGTTTFTYHVPKTANSAGGTFESQGNLFTYMFGPQVTIPLDNKRIFAEALFGGANTNVYANLFKAAGVTGLSSSNNGFAMAIGGGFDIAITDHVAVRPVQFDYLLTRYEWKPIGINNQSNFRFQAGVVFAFGSL